SMSHRERQASAGATAPVAPPPPTSGPGPPAALRPAPAADAATHWELLYHGIPPAQQAELLALASEQGLLYSHQLPAAAPARGAPPGDEPRTWNLLGKMLTGQAGQLEAVRPAPVQVLAEALAEAQRRAVAAALASPDVCLIQGLPGTGKSRVAAEVVSQAAQRGDRVLLLAASAAAVDRVLEQVAHRTTVC